MRLALRRQSGDTIIEVMFAFAVFAAVAVGSISLMNRSSAIAQRSLEITQVRAQIDAQADALRFIHQKYTANYPAANAEWTKLIGRSQTSATQFGVSGTSTSCPSITGSATRKPFIINAQMATVRTSPVPTIAPPASGTLPPYSQVAYNTDGSILQAYGIWIEAVPVTGSGNKPGFVDFHIRACWSAAGAVIPMTLGTIVRLYVPQA